LKIQVGVSRCLIGDEVRYDGSHKRDRYVHDVLGQYFDWVPVCPEVEIGLPVPRPTIRLVRIGDDLRVLGSRDPSLDVTEALDGLYERERFAAVRGFILKRGSPSCGTQRVKLYDEEGRSTRTGVGAFARALMTDRPTLPVEEEGRLDDVRLRENFVTRVFAYDRWCGLVGQPVDVAALQRFHASHELLLMAHDRAGHRRLGPLVAAARPDSLTRTLRDYERGFMDTLSRRASTRSHATVLRHLAGYLEGRLDAGDAAELADVIDRYRRGLHPLLVPLTLLRHHLRRHPHPQVARQVYLDPHPSELMLHNHA